MIAIIDLVFTAHYRENASTISFFRFNDFDTEKGNLSEKKKMFAHQLKVLHNHHECSIQ